MTHTKKDPQQKLSSKERLILKRKEAKKHRTTKRARLLVKNLPFTVTEENLKEYFEKYGEVTEVNLLKKPDGKLVGCAFIQFKLVQKAAKAQYHTNGKEFMDRSIGVNFALSKDIYKKKVDVAEDSVEIKEEPIDSNDIDLTIIKNEEDEIKDEDKIDDDSNESDSDNSDVDSDEEDDEDVKEDDIESEESDVSEDEKLENVGEEKDEEEKSKTKKAHVISHDVKEGKTVFVKNIPFSATNEDFKQCMRQFGPVYYALICMDKFTEHSKGTGFVKFINAEDAEKCLQAGTELTLLGNILDCHKAIDKNDVGKKGEDKNSNKEKDSRHLYLIKEGVILAGSKAAEGVSASDMAKRLQLEQYKTQMLRNLNMFISLYRLIIHNVPPSWDDAKLKALFQKYSEPKAVIKEAKIMRDFRKVDSNGKGISREYGFVTFARHEDALKALRTLNNNPKIFNANKRPIVAFSIENKIMIKAKQKRLERSILNNPKCKQYKPIIKSKESEESLKHRGKKRKITTQVDDGNDVDKFAGVIAKPGNKKMRSRFKLQTQAQMHHENLKKEKHRKKFAKKPLKERQKDFTKQPRQKINKKSEKDDFSKLVNEYKKKLYDANLNTKKNKWYEES